MNSPRQPPQAPLSLPEKLAQDQADHRLWSKVAASPGLSPEAAAWAANAARSYAAAAKISRKALAYQQPNSDAAAALEQDPPLQLQQPSAAPPSALAATENTPKPPAPSSGKSAFSAKEMGLLTSQMVSSEARYMLAMKTQQVLSRSPAKSAPPHQELERRAQQRPEFPEGTRGNIRFGAGRPVISLTRDADASTFIHEIGHQWLEELMRDGEHEAAPLILRTDAGTVRNWLGVERGDRIKTPQHEKFARGFEQYMREGIAPSPQLAGTFAKFKNLLIPICPTIEGLGEPINDDIRGVFDRMLATELKRSANESAGRAPSATLPCAIWAHRSLSRFIAKALRAVAEVAVFALAAFVVFGFLHLIVTADPVWFLAALAFGGLIWIGKSRS